MDQPFFPNLPFALAFAAVLAAGLGVAAWQDWKSFVVTKRVTVGMLACGVVMNVARGAWLSAQGNRVWLFEPGNALLGGLDGFLFAAAGFFTGFALMFLFWIFGSGGGGDVKLVGAVGAWLGWGYILATIIFSMPFLMILVIVSMAYRLLGGKLPQQPTYSVPGHPNARKRGTSYALAVCLAAGTVLGLLLVGYTQYVHAGPPAPG